MKVSQSLQRDVRQKTLTMLTSAASPSAAAATTQNSSSAAVSWAVHMLEACACQWQRLQPAASRSSSAAVDLSSRSVSAVTVGVSNTRKSRVLISENQVLIKGFLCEPLTSFLPQYLLSCSSLVLCQYGACLRPSPMSSPTLLCWGGARCG